MGLESNTAPTRFGVPTGTPWPPGLLLDRPGHKRSQRLPQAFLSAATVHQSIQEQIKPADHARLEQLEDRPTVSRIRAGNAGHAEQDAGQGRRLRRRTARLGHKRYQGIFNRGRTRLLRQDRSAGTDGNQDVFEIHAVLAPCDDKGARPRRAAPR